MKYIMVHSLYHICRQRWNCTNPWESFSRIVMSVQVLCLI